MGTRSGLACLSSHIHPAAVTYTTAPDFNNKGDGVYLTAKWMSFALFLVGGFPGCALESIEGIVMRWQISGMLMEALQD